MYRVGSLFRSLFFILLALNAPRVSMAYAANGALPVEDFQVEYTFGERLAVRGSLVPQPGLQSISLVIQPRGEVAFEPISVIPDESGEMLVEYDLSENRLRPFTTIDFRFLGMLESGEILNSETFSLVYDDNRFDWRTLDNGIFQVHWFKGDLSFAQQVLNTAQSGLERALNYLPTPQINERQINIYVYSSANEVQLTIKTAGLDWVAGHADPDLNVILVSLPPGPEQRLEMERQIPHELMHLLIFQNAGSGYDETPTWLSEGMASITELYPNPDYTLLLEDAHQNGSLIPMKDLCRGFSRNASDAILAYAQATAFTRYLYNQYGNVGLQSLVDSYATGVECERGAQLAIGSPLSELERDWLTATFSTNNPQAGFEELLPWLLLLGIILLGPLVLTLRSRRPPSSTAVTHSTQS